MSTTRLRDEDEAWNSLDFPPIIEYVFCFFVTKTEFEGRNLDATEDCRLHRRSIMG